MSTKHADLGCYLASHPPTLRRRSPMPDEVPASPPERNCENGRAESTAPRQGIGEFALSSGKTTISSIIALFVDCASSAALACQYCARLYGGCASVSGVGTTRNWEPTARELCRNLPSVATVSAASTRSGNGCRRDVLWSDAFVRKVVSHRDGAVGATASVSTATCRAVSDPPGHSAVMLQRHGRRRGRLKEIGTGVTSPRLCYNRRTGQVLGRSMGHERRCDADPGPD